MKVSLGQEVRVGDVVGITSDPLKRTRGDLISRRRGRVIGVSLLPMVVPGMAVVHLGIADARFDDNAEPDEEIDADRPE